MLEEQHENIQSIPNKKRVEILSKYIKDAGYKKTSIELKESLVRLIAMKNDLHKVSDKVMINLIYADGRL